MIVITLTDCPNSLRGDLTRWLMEADVNVFVGNVSARVRDELWERITGNAKSGRATLVYPAANEQGMVFRVHNSNWEICDYDGLNLMMRPHVKKEVTSLQGGFSSAYKQRKVQRIQKNIVSKRKHADAEVDYSFIVFDLETTGLSIWKDMIIEIAAVRVRNGEIEDRFQRFVKIEIPLPEEITELTGITEQQLNSEGCDLSTAIREFMVFVESYPLVSHNADFDCGFLRKACTHAGLSAFQNECIDTLALSRRLVRDVPNYKLSTLADYFHISTNGFHRGCDDCEVTVMLYKELIKLDG